MEQDRKQGGTTAATWPTVNLKRLRLDRGLSAAKAAAEMGLKNGATLRNAERGHFRPHPENQLKICEFYGLAPTEVWPPVDDLAAEVA